MFLNVKRQGYNRNEEAVCHGDFLVIFNLESGGELRAVVRHARMRQLGHWMMAGVKVGDQNITLSGAYGGDGLPVENRLKTEALWNRLHVVPAELQEAFWHGGGHNTSGKEGPAMQAWAQENLSLLKNLKPESE